MPSADKANHARPGDRDEPDGLSANIQLHDSRLWLDMLAADLGASGGELLRTAVRLSPVTAERMHYAEFLGSLQQTTCCWLLGSSAGAIWLELEPRIARMMVNCLLGGPAEAGADQRPVTLIEHGIGRRFAEATAEALSKRLEEKLGLLEDRPAGLNPRQAVLVATFNVTLTGEQGTMRLCLPAKLAVPASADPAGASGATAEAEPAENPTPAGESVELSVVAAETLMPSAELAALAPGDVLITDADAAGQLVVRINGRGAFVGRLGSRNGKRAVTIIRPLDKDE